MEHLLHCGRFFLSFDRPLLMGIVNLTDDSFSGDGLGADTERAIAHGLRLKAEGADILDIGAESTRPGAEAVTAEREIQRILPVVAGLRDCGLPLSVDTMKPAVMKAALAAGADMINDVMALRTPGAMEAIAASNAAVCLMHMQGEPRSMQADPRYGDVVTEVAEFLAERIAAAEAAGIGRERIVIDPGFGFGKTLEHNLQLLKQLDELVVPDLALLAGMSRKNMLGLLTGRPVEERLPAGIAAHLLAVRRGARILRVHDVAAMRDALAVECC
jgi:dihydropteroate synthase